MNDLRPDPGSFRDPGGRVYSSGSRILRTVMPSSVAPYEAARNARLYDRLIERGLLIGIEELDGVSREQLDNEAPYLLAHPRIPFISYPYEWSFLLHKEAALHHLAVQLAALDEGFTLTDSTAYNVQFVGTKPLFIDHLSFRPYVEGEVWIGHKQFCAQFLNPLIFWSRLGSPPNHWFRGSLEGIQPEELSPLLSWSDNLSWTIFSHVTAQASLQRRSTRSGVDKDRVKAARLPRGSYRAMLIGLRQFIEGCSIPHNKTVWSDYASDNSYAAGEAAGKLAFVREMVAAAQPALLIDLGCNSGDYSAAALQAGAKMVVGFDYDFGALEAAVRRSRNGNLNFLPLWLDAANPSPSQGWAQAERQGLSDRAKGNALIALAFIHHIAIARNVPLDMTLDWIMAMAPTGILEFPPKNDPMVQRLLENREDIFPEYSEQNFLFQIQQRASVVKCLHLSQGGRLLVWYDRRKSS